MTSKTKSYSRGEIWLVDFGNPIGREQAGTRPAVVVSANPLNNSQAELAIVIPCTTAKRNIPSHVEIDPSDTGLQEMSYAKCEDIKSISEIRLITRLGRTNHLVLTQIDTNLRFLLEL